MLEDAILVLAKLSGVRLLQFLFQFFLIAPRNAKKKHITITIATAKLCPASNNNNNKTTFVSSLFFFSNWPKKALMQSQY